MKQETPGATQAEHKQQAPPLPADLVRRFATSFCVSRTYKHVKPFGRELSRHFAADAFIRSGN